MMDYKVEFELDWKKNVIMKLVSNNQVVFYENVTDEVIPVTTELLADLKSTK